MTKISRIRPDQSKARFEPVTFTPEQVKEIAQSLIQFRADHIFLDSHRVVWTLKYPDRWVVVKDQKLVGYGKNKLRLYQRLRKRGIDIVTLPERHDGDYPGNHARYVLKSAVSLVGGRDD